MKMLAVSMILLAVFSSGCVSLQSVTSGQIGCAETDIQILEDNTGWGSRTWTAECNGKVYFCSAHGGGGQGATAQVSCKEQSGATKSAAPAGTSGCKSDVQCKGDRICERGQCVSPPK